MKNFVLLLILVVAALATEEYLPGPPQRDRCPKPTPKVPKCRYFTDKKSFGPVASYFNLFIHHDFVCSGSDTEGRVAVGGNFDSSAGGYDIGCRTYATNTQCKDATCAAINLVVDFPHALVVGGDLKYGTGQVHSGSIAYGGSIVGNPTVVSSDCGAPQHATPINFDAEFANLIKTSNAVNNLPTTGTTSVSYNQIVFTGQNKDDLEVFRVSAAQLHAAVSIDFSNVNSKATIIINADGTDFDFGGFSMFHTVGLEHNLLWNFADALSIKLHSLQFAGTILAPKADIVTSAGGVIHGGVIANSYKSVGGGCFQINYYEFWGCVPDDTPDVPPPGNQCVEPFGPVASGYNTFVFDHYYCISSDVEGRVAAGGNIHVTNWAAGCKIFPPSNGNCLSMGEKLCADIPQGTNTYTLVAGMSVDLTNTEVKVGDVAYGFEYNQASSSIASDCHAYQDSTVVDFGKAQAYLVCLSRTLKQAKQTGRYTNEYNQLVLYGSGVADTEVFNIGGFFLASAVSLEIKNVKQGATIIINVDGVDLPIGGFEFFPVGAFPQEYVVWNFWEATRLRFYSVGWRGVVLAPRALIADSNGAISGQVFARSWEQKSACIQVNWVPFKGCLPDCTTTPLPPTVGCADGEREGFTDQTKYPCIAACKTKWSQPGVIGKVPTCNRQAGDDVFSQPAGCSVEDACAPGWHVCKSQTEVSYAFRRDGSCADAGPGFYTSQVSGPGCGVCAVDWGQDTTCNGFNCYIGCKPNALTKNDLFGCGSLTNSDGTSANAAPEPETCSPFNIFSGNLCGAVPGLDCGSGAGITEADDATKSAYAGGGVLCCIDQCADRTTNDNVIG